MDTLISVCQVHQGVKEQYPETQEGERNKRQPIVNPSVAGMSDIFSPSMTFRFTTNPARPRNHFILRTKLRAHKLNNVDYDVQFSVQIFYIGEAKHPTRLNIQVLALPARTQQSKKN